METFLGLFPLPRQHGLETFLSGMETRDRGAVLVQVAPLETFLSGMETGPSSCRFIRQDCLETFLSGMETSGRDAEPRSHSALKPSLVEWKPRNKHFSPCKIHNLETFLSGMETNKKDHLQSYGIALKPSLVEWKRRASDLPSWVPKHP